MSIPPHLIRVKRKRVEESPVTFLQFDDGVKRHRTGSNWVYQRRHVGPQSPEDVSKRLARDAKPVIHISTPDEDNNAQRHDAGHGAEAGGIASGTQAPAHADANKPAEPRRFHISRKMMMPSGVPGSGGNKKGRYGPAVFVERSRGKATKRAAQPVASPQTLPIESIEESDQSNSMVLDPPAERRLKRPGVKSRSHSPQDPNRRAPLPASVMSPHSQDMTKVTADMNDWVLAEIGANLQDMELERQKAQKARFKPKAPAKRYQERHPDAQPNVVPGAPESTEMDTAMSDVSDMDDDDDWVIDEYVRIPAHAMSVDVAPADVGVLVLDGEKDNNLFFGPDRDDDEDADEDDEDENAENYYTADYPEDEVASDDEFGRYAYAYRNANASDNEEYDNAGYSESEDEMVIEGDGDDATMARIKAYMKRSRAFQ